MPRLTAVFLLITLASIGLPTLNGFIGEFLIILGSFAWKWPYAAVAASGVILSAVYMLWMVQRVYYGPVTNQKNQSLPDLELREWAAALPLVAAAIVMGVLPTLVPEADRAGCRQDRSAPGAGREFRRPPVETGD